MKTYRLYSHKWISKLIVVLIISVIFFLSQGIALAQDDENLPPVANLQLDVTKHPVSNAVKVLDQVYFIGEESYDPTPGDNITFLWDFGDESTSNQNSPVHIYNQVGEYIVTLTVNDSELNDSMSLKIFVFSEGGNVPVAKINIDAKRDGFGNNFANVSESILFDATQSYDPDGSQLNFEWDFGDGAKSLETITSHEYNDNGVYTALLSVTDGEGLVSRDTVSIIVGTGKPVGDEPKENNEDEIIGIGIIFLVIAVVAIILLVLTWLYINRLRNRTVGGTPSSISSSSEVKPLTLDKSRLTTRPPVPEFAKPEVSKRDTTSRVGRVTQLTAQEGKMKQVMLRQKLKEERKKLDDDMKKELQDMGIEL
jgi:PKD repeat protein